MHVFIKNSFQTEVKTKANSRSSLNTPELGSLIWLWEFYKTYTLWSNTDGNPLVEDQNDQVTKDAKQKQNLEKENGYHGKNYKEIMCITKKGNLIKSSFIKYKNVVKRKIKSTTRKPWEIPIRNSTYNKQIA